MDFHFSAEAGLTGLFVASFLAATLLPGGSEAVLLGVVSQHPGDAGAAWLAATAGNTLGGMLTYLMGRLVPQKLGAGRTAPAYLGTVQKHGAALLVLAWLPLVGDAFCAAAGWLRLPWLRCLVWMATGKGARYLALLAGFAVW